MKNSFGRYVKVFLFAFALFFVGINGMVVQAKEDSIFTEAEYEQLERQLNFVYENALDFGLQK